MSDVSVQGPCMVKARYGNGTWSESRPEIVVFAFNVADPAAVRMVIDDVPWTFDRTLLEEAVADLSKPLGVGFIGLGDVRVGRGGMSHVQVKLASPEGEAHVELKVALVVKFTALVAEASPEPPTYDVDAWLDGLLKGESA